MGTKTKKGSAFTFAHLLGRAGISADDKNDDDKSDDERKQRDGESDDDYAKRMEDLDKKDKDGGDDADAEDDNDDPDADSANESDKEKAARGRERARCAAIFGNKAASARPDVAAHLAFNTDMSVTAAVDMLAAFAVGGMPAPAAKSLASRMAGVPVQIVGTGAAAPANPAQGAAAMILAAGKKRRGEA